MNGVYASGTSIYAATAAGLSLSTNSGTNWTTYTTTNGLASNTVYGVYASGGVIYAATAGGVSYSTNGGTIWGYNTTTDGLGSNTVKGVFVSDNKVYAATSGGLSVAPELTPDPVPAPLPLFGAALPLGFCRRLRSRSKRLRHGASSRLVS